MAISNAQWLSYLLLLYFQWSFSVIFCIIRSICDLVLSDAEIFDVYKSFFLSLSFMILTCLMSRRDAVSSTSVPGSEVGALGYSVHFRQLQLFCFGFIPHWRE